ncbi:MAG: cytochrome d ubiquinol oxidase subunit II [Deltaproteobacteria bacterium]|nr:cytochrome d ubiquinol oxidase subunit II [Deltaproteobacteria bacterium]
MHDLSLLAAGAILASLILYALLGGADFGGGVWDLLSRGPRSPAHRALIAQAIGPIWETNHIWVIVAVVILFTGFPHAFALVSTALFLPVTLLLAGIVLRGAAFAFHSYHLHDEEGERRRWGLVFAGSSLITPLLLGVVIGAVSSGGIRAAEAAAFGASRAWLAPFPISVGFLTLSVFSYLAAVYLIFETDDPALREDFRLRALWSSAAVGVLMVIVPLLARRGAQDFHHSLLGSDWSPGLVFLAATAALGAHVSLLLRSYPVARICAAAQAVIILAGWGAAQYPFLVRPDVTVPAAASPQATLRFLLIALAAGGMFLFPAIGWLFWVFKKDAVFGRTRNP